MNKKKLKRIPLTIRLRPEIHSSALKRKAIIKKQTGKDITLSNIINDIVEEKLK